MRRRARSAVSRAMLADEAKVGSRRWRAVVAALGAVRAVAAPTAPVAPFLPFLFKALVELLRRRIRGAGLQARGEPAVAEEPLHWVV